MFYVNLMLDHS